MIKTPVSEIQRRLTDFFKYDDSINRAFYLLEELSIHVRYDQLDKDRILKALELCLDLISEGKQKDIK